MDRIPDPIRHATVQPGEIEPDPVELARDTDPEARRQLADDMRANGQIHECMVGEKNEAGKHPLLVGHRRYSAALVAQLPLRVAVYSLLTAAQIRLLRLRENLGRKDYSAYEVYLRLAAILADTPGLTQDGLAKTLCYSQSKISKYLALNKGIPAVHQAVKAGKLSVEDAAAISAKPQDRQQTFLDLHQSNRDEFRKATARKPRAEGVRLDKVRMVVNGLSIVVSGKQMSLSDVHDGLEAAVKEISRAIKTGLDLKAVSAMAAARSRAK